MNVLREATIDSFDGEVPKRRSFLDCYKTIKPLEWNVERCSYLTAAETNQDSYAGFSFFCETSNLRRVFCGPQGFEKVSILFGMKASALVTIRHLGVDHIQSMQTRQ